LVFLPKLSGHTARQANVWATATEWSLLNVLQKPILKSLFIVVDAGLPDGIFAYQNPSLGIFLEQTFVNYIAVWNILRPFWYILWSFGMLYLEKSGI
jgi:hypothetical protein